MHAMRIGSCRYFSMGFHNEGCGNQSLFHVSALLQRYPHAQALVVSMENITQNWYFGNERSMLIPNCLFRVGGAACLLSNRLRDSWRAK